MSSISSNRIPSLDGLRAISILLVIASHAAFIFGFSSFFNVGDLGVRVFFAISGFLITGLLIRELDKADKINLVKFYFRRTLRIFPPYYFFLLIFVLLAVAGKVQISLAQFLPVFTYTSNYIFPGDWNLDHAWSLSVEEQFYLIYPGFLVLFGRHTIAWLLGVSLLICPIVRFADFQLFSYLQPIWMTKGFHANLDTLAIGCLLALKHKWLHENQLYRQILDSKFMFAVPVLLITVNAQIDYPGLNLGLLFSFNNILIALTIDWAVTHHANIAGKILNSRPFVFIGMMSYSIYLWQQPFLLNLGAFVNRYLNPDLSSKHFAFPYSLCAFALCCGVSYFAVEKYSLKLRRYGEKVFFARRPKLINPKTVEA